MFLDVTQRCRVGFCFWSLYVWTRNIEVSTSNRVFAESFASSDPFGLFTNIVFLGGNTKTFETYLNRNVKTCSLLSRLLGGQIFQTDLKNCMRSRPGFHIARSLEVRFTLEPPFLGWVDEIRRVDPTVKQCLQILVSSKSRKNGEVCIFGACIQFKSVLMVLKTV